MLFMMYVHKTAEFGSDFEDIQSFIRWLVFHTLAFQLSSGKAKCFNVHVTTL